jgi:hypothetical protein
MAAELTSEECMCAEVRTTPLDGRLPPGPLHDR